MSLGGRGSACSHLLRGLGRIVQLLLLKMVPAFATTYALAGQMPSIFTRSWMLRLNLSLLLLHRR